VFSGDPPARSEATEGGVEHPLPRSEQGGRLDERGSLVHRSDFWLQKSDCGGYPVGLSRLGVRPDG
jgi:hypothetical protein